MQRLSTRIIDTGVRSLIGVLASLAIAAHAYSQNTTAELVPGQSALALSPFDLTSLGYATEEFFVSGTAASYTLTGTVSETGFWTAVSAESAPYTTRIVVARPTDPGRFSGTVVVEWLNVTAGADGAPDWTMLHRELMRSGHAWIGVSAQQVGVEGGQGAIGGFGAQALKQANPERYARLSHPGDAWSYGIYSQAGSLARATGNNSVLGPLVAQHVISVGESQSAVFLTTYVNAVDPIVKVYDGFLIHSRFGSAASLGNAGMNGMASGLPRYVQLRTDLRAPVVTLITETDMLDTQVPGFHGARQPDNERLRVWEVPGTAHADNYVFSVGAIDSGSTPIEQLAAAYAPTANVRGIMQLAKPMNNAPQHHYVLQAALRQLDQWIRTGVAPPSADPMTLASSDGPKFAEDANRNVEGGVRTPWVDVPIGRLSGLPNSGGPLGFLVGSSETYDKATLARLYPDGAGEYQDKFAAALDSAITAGFILTDDRQEILDLAVIGARVFEAP